MVTILTVAAIVIVLFGFVTALACCKVSGDCDREEDYKMVLEDNEKVTQL